MSRWDNYFMDVAKRTAKLSHANRLKVGAVAVRDRRIICVGFNGTPPGCDNACEDSNNKTLPTVIHAEDNLVRFAQRNNIDLTGCTVYVTHSPCYDCAYVLHKAGVNAVVYSKLFRKIEGLMFLSSVNIQARLFNKDLLYCARQLGNKLFNKIF